MQYGFGVDLGGTTAKIALFNGEGELLSKWEIPTRTQNNGAEILPDIAASVLNCLRERNIPKDAVLGVGIGVPGPVDGDGIVPACDNLGWGRTDISKELEALVGLRVVAGNDATVAALGEYWACGGTGKSMVMVTLGTGVGGGIIVDGKPLHGTHGAAGEIGHLVLNTEETEYCNCGKRGCAEQYCSATGIVRLAKAYLASHQEDSCLRGREFNCKDVFDAAGAGDVAAQAILEQVYAYLGLLIANVCIVLNPSQVVIGGGVSKAGEPLLAGFKRYFDKYIYHASTQVEFRLATLGNDAGSYGAFRLLLG